MNSGVLKAKKKLKTELFRYLGKASIGKSKFLFRVKKQVDTLLIKCLIGVLELNV